MNSSRGDRIAIAILAAGSSTRMGAVKQLLPWQGTTMIRSVVAQARASGLGPVAVVLGAHGERIAAELVAEPVILLDNPRHRSGPGSSVHAAVRWSTGVGCDRLIIMLADQPLITACDLHALVQVAQDADAPAAGAAYADGPGVPALFTRTCFPLLMDLPEHHGAKSLLRSLPHVATVPLVGVTDIDTPADYALAGKKPTTP